MTGTDGTLEMIWANSLEEDTEPYFGTDLFTGRLLHIQARAIGGLKATEFETEPGITAFVGQNATNRSSVLRGIAATLGAELSPEGLLRTDADSGVVTIAAPDVGDSPAPELKLNLHRRDDGSVNLSRSGTIDPEWSASEATNFVALFEDNPIRAAITRGETSSLYEHLMAPVDIEALEREIEEVKRERSSIEDRISALEDRKANLPGLEQELQQTIEAIEQTQVDLEEAREHVDSLNTNAEEAQQAEALVDELEDTKSDLEQAHEDLELQRREIEDLEEKRAEVERKLEELDTPDDDLDNIKAEISELRGERRSLKDTVNELRRIVEFNQEMLKGESQLSDAVESDNILAELDPEQKQVECWTCGSTVQRDAISDRLDELREFLSQKERRLSEINSDIEDLRDDKKALEVSQEQRERYEDRLEQMDRDMERRRSCMPELEERIEELEAEVDELEQEVKETRDARESEILDAYQEVSQYEVELESYESEREELKEKITDIEDEIEEIPSLEEEREELTTKLGSLRNHVVDREEAIIEAFNDQMDTILFELAYSNLSRVWIERKVSDGKTARAAGGANAEFELHIIRESDENGAAYEDTLATLSESEREVVGLTVAVAGYLAHDIADSLPVLLLDSLEAIDAARLQEFITYIADETDVEYLIAALLPEDAEHMPESVSRQMAQNFVAA